MSTAHELRVKSIVRETSRAVSVGLEVPSELQQDYRYQAGQYLTLEKEIAGRKFRRSYSICSSPESEDLRVTVKEVEGGTFSAWVNNKLKIEDDLDVFLPEGRFTFEPSTAEKEKTYIAFAAGSGITPVMAILKNVLEAEPHSKFVLVYGNKTPEETIFYKELLELQLKYTDQLYIEFIYSREKAKDSLFGRIERKTVDYFLENKFKDIDFEAFYLCGPEPMIDMISQELKEKEVPGDKVHFELFYTEEKKDKVKEEVSGKTKVTVILDDEETTFEMERKNRVLDAVMDEGLDPPYSCQGGICSSCMAQVAEGRVEMANNQILSDEEVKDGFVLTCQSHPTTPTLIIDYDDV